MTAAVVITLFSNLLLPGKQGAPAAAARCAAHVSIEGGWRSQTDRLSDCIAVLRHCCTTLLEAKHCTRCSATTRRFGTQAAEPALPVAGTIRFHTVHALYCEAAALVASRKPAFYAAYREPIALVGWLHQVGSAGNARHYTSRAMGAPKMPHTTCPPTIPARKQAWTMVQIAQHDTNQLQLRHISALWMLLLMLLRNGSVWMVSPGWRPLQSGMPAGLRPGHATRQHPPPQSFPLLPCLPVVHRWPTRARAV